MTNNFITHFSIIKDPRIERCKKHALIDILFLSICAVLSGAEGWEDIEDFGHVKLDWLRRYLPFHNGIPKHDTIARVMSRLEPEAIQTCFINWVKELITEVDGEIIAIDGKSARGSFSTKNRKDSLHMVSAWSCENGLVLGQQKVEGKSNEITAIPKLLDLLDVKGATITLDAMGCQHAIINKIHSKGADYVVSLKGNQGQLNKEVKAWFHKCHREQFANVGHSIYEHITSGHGRIEERRCIQLEIDKNWLTEHKKWANIQTVICIEAKCHIGEKVTIENRYYISSLSLNAERLNSIIRNHWAIENSLHWTLDMTFHEDNSRIRRGNAAEVMNAFRKLALNIVKTDTTRKASMKRKLKMAALDDNFRAQLLLNIN
ncbi:ISAs1 family transposase [Pasteurella atlantica]|uniref:ISAs1 family transposase n=4 Tax=Pasteurellales TaxID=135625 RepID=A0ACC6HQ41_9PAST|nr:ISAs1 family transposase [Pasteurella atlantica]MDP8034604.1 ISAs1 family transposase [Pasteurella atlantica]MDP8036546.1 ISAs1 family transposase [Pasteurella atlantica]MDP8038494.1 ISAs1 family transposase [Pasteurella atlantica]MDP8048842.1 ISAs1 family transposase [Pasteurella atlantica]MDP8050790.1 ISAs1 family transposase [Pasteurella atlantica]